MPRKRTSKKSKRDKRIKVDVWVTDSVREAIQFAVDGERPANDTAVRNHFQDVVDRYSIKIVEDYINHGKPLKE